MLHLYVINNLYKGKGILIPLILLTYFSVYPELFYSLFSIILSKYVIRFSSILLDSYFYKSYSNSIR
ncbi:hypothetical protein GGR08_001428 [Bartonella fuyuanensis]|uniref:Uncharacterized protein n=1 Tax=Bartonella fuyuanensis TaxID=1460968 RepID=A0A840DVS4_9HYPH|nr:hypothetical protein [Bartonella fuyuanensis]